MIVAKTANRYRVYLDWVAYKDDYKLPVYYDYELSLVDPFHDYIVYLAKKKLIENAGAQAYKSEIEAASYALKSLLDFLSIDRRNWKDVNDLILVDYRNWALEQLLQSEKSKQDEKAAKRSINVKLRHIYRYYVWAQNYARIIDNWIGPTDCSIQSTLSVDGRQSETRQSDALKYPVCFRRVGEGSRSRGQYTATQNDKIKLIEYFTGTQTLEAAERNIIIMEIADQVGWRNGSIHDLTADQFSWDLIESESGDSLQVTPQTQKLGYDKSFEVPIGLAGWIARYIDRRNEIMKRNGWTEKTAKRRIFLNLNTGLPIGIKTITQIFSLAFTAIGAPKKRNAGIHSFRRKFTQEATAKELHERKSRGLSTAVEDVLFAIARKLGQEKIYSQEPYQRAISDDIRQSPTSKLEQQLKELEKRFAEQELENARLRKLIDVGDNNLP